MVHAGRDTGVRAMLERLSAACDTIRHGACRHVADPAGGRIAGRLNVVNTGFDGAARHKRNGNFFELKDGLIHRVSICMSGENTLV